MPAIKTRIRLVHGDITSVEADAVVTAANEDYVVVAGLMVLYMTRLALNYLSRQWLSPHALLVPPKSLKVSTFLPVM